MRRRSSASRVERMERKGDVDGLIDELEHGKGAAAFEAAMALGRMQDPRAAEPVLRLLRSIDLPPASDDEAGHLEWEWEVLAYTLGQVADPGSPAADELLLALAGPNEAAAYAAMSALAQMDERRAIEPLLERLRKLDYDSPSPDAKEFYEVSDALATLEASEAVEPLIAALEVDDFQEGAAEALGNIGDARAVPALAAMLSPKPRVWVGVAIVNALEEIGTPEAKAAVAAWKADETRPPDFHEWRVEPIKPPPPHRRLYIWWILRRSMARFRPGGRTGD